MVGSQVHLSVPNVSLESRAGAIAILAEREISNLVAVHQVFEGDITGRALLIFPETKSLELVRAITGGDLPLEDIIELEQEALAETGNILLNSCLATIANMLQRSLKMSLPEVLRGNAATFFSLAPPPEAGEQRAPPRGRQRENPEDPPTRSPPHISDAIRMRLVFAPLLARQPRSRLQRSSSFTAFTLPCLTARASAAWSCSFWSAYATPNEAIAWSKESLLPMYPARIPG